MDHFDNIDKLIDYISVDLVDRAERSGYIGVDDTREFFAEMENRVETWKIVRFYRATASKRTIKTDLTFEQALEHCSDDEATSSTCKKAVNKRRTKRIGQWFDAYYVE